MNTIKTSSRQEGYGTVEVIDDNTIHVRLFGFITGEIARQVMAETLTLVQQIHKDKKQAYLLLDIRKISGQNSDARSAAKEIRNFGLDKIAIIGGSRALKMIAQYIVRSGGMSTYTKFFPVQAAAQLWLKEPATIGHKSGQIRIVVMAILIAGITIIAAGALVGWYFDIPFLASVNSKFKAMNPIVALTFLWLCVGLALTLKKRRRFWEDIVLATVIIWPFIFGVATLIRWVTGFDTYADAWLFINQLESQSYSGRASPLASILMILSSILFWLFFIVKKNAKHYYTVEFLIAAIMTVANCVIIGYSFDAKALYTLGTGLPMPLNTAFCFLLLSSFFIVLFSTKIATTPARRFALAYWQGMVIFFAIVILTGFTWQQTRSDIDKDKTIAVSRSFNTTVGTIESRFSAYIETLRGYKAFFAASETVSAAEFNTYFTNSDIQKHYPGINGISFVKAVPRDQKTAFTASVRKTASNANSPYTNYTIYPEGINSIMYPVLFIEPQTTASGYGFDLSTNEERLKTIELARDTGQPTATGMININQSRGAAAPNRNGFFISMPIYTQDAFGDPVTQEGRIQRSFGFVHAVFADDNLFGDIFRNISSENVKYRVAYEDTGQTMYETKSSNGGMHLERTVGLNVAGQRWRVSMFTTENFGLTETQRFAPYLVLFGGLSLAILAGLLIISKTRQRHQALELASHMTEDLQNERNNAVTLQQKDEAILSSIGDAVFAIDPKGIITLLNPAAVRISGYNASDAIGKHYTEILKFEVAATGKPNTRFINRALGGEVTTMGVTTILTRKDGGRIQVADSAAPIRSSKGEIMGVIVVFRDISKEYELDKAKTEFVSLASHQLRTPLSAIGWYSEMLLGGDAGKLTKRQREYLHEIYEGNQRMIELVTSLLDVSRLDLGKLTNNPTPIDSAELINSLEKEMATTITSKGIHFRKQIKKKLAPIEVDAKLVRMIFQNIISNAIKYTPDHGNVTVTLREATSQEAGQAGIRSHKPALFFSVSDTGYGIPKAQQQKIFSKLFRADNVRALDVEGTGLGLYIVKQAAQKLGGDVWFDSIESAGTTFYVVLPHITKKEGSVK